MANNFENKLHSVIDSIDINILDDVNRFLYMNISNVL